MAGPERLLWSTKDRSPLPYTARFDIDTLVTLAHTTPEALLPKDIENLWEARPDLFRPEESEDEGTSNAA